MYGLSLLKWDVSHMLLMWNDDLHNPHWILIPLKSEYIMILSLISQNTWKSLSFFRNISMNWSLSIFKIVVKSFDFALARLAIPVKKFNSPKVIPDFKRPRIFEYRSLSSCLSQSLQIENQSTFALKSSNLFAKLIILFYIWEIFWLFSFCFICF